jgi:hypothetical protein
MAETGAVLRSAHIGHYLWARQHKLPINKFTTHDLRRTVATMMAEMSVALDLVAAVIGHEAAKRPERSFAITSARTSLSARLMYCAPGTSDSGTSWLVASPPTWCAF